MKQMKRISTLLLAAFVLCTTMTTAFADETMYIGVSPDTYLRGDESAKNPYIARMPYGSEVTYISSRTVGGVSWSFIIYNEQFGYCKTKYLQTENPYEGFTPHPISMEEAFGSNLLQKGNKTPDYHVKNLQLCLIETGFLAAEPGADGYFGKDTVKALAQYQKANRLDPAGRAGQTTKSVLWYEYGCYLSENGVMQ